MVFYPHMSVTKAVNRVGLELILDSVTLTSRNNDANNVQPFPSKGAFLVRDNRVLNGPLGCSLRLFARTAHYIHSPLSTPLCSLPRGTVENVFTL